MAEGKRSWMPNWRSWLPRRRWFVAGIVLALAALLLWKFPPPWTDRGATYEIYSMTNYSGENRNEIAAGIKDYLTEDFPPDEYEYLGIIAQRHPTTQDPTTTTYVLFKRK